MRRPLRVFSPAETESGIRLRTTPRTRGECVDGERPCPHLLCRYHLYRDTPAREESCSLDVADRGAHTLQDVADIMGVVKERVRQIEKRAVEKIRPFVPDEGWVHAEQETMPADDMITRDFADDVNKAMRRVTGEKKKPWGGFR